MVRILTFVLAKDQSAFNREGYASVLRQQDVKQDIYVISAEPILCINNFVVRIPEGYPVSIRVATSINEALKHYWSPKYDYFFKIDSDIILDPDYLMKQIEKDTPMIGLGWTLLIRNDVFNRVFHSRWFVSYSDDFCMIAKAFSYGFIDSIYEPEGHYRMVNTPLFDRERLYWAGHEFRKIGFPLWFTLVNSIVEMSVGNVKAKVYDLSGYIHAFNVRKYDFAKNFEGRLTRIYFGKRKSYFRKMIKRLEGTLSDVGTGDGR